MLFFVQSLNFFHFGNACGNAGFRLFLHLVETGFQAGEGFVEVAALAAAFSGQNDGIRGNVSDSHSRFTTVAVLPSGAACTG